MTFEEELKHVATYSNIYEILWDGPKKFDVAKQYLMREYEKPEFTAKSYITSIRNGNTELMTVDEVAGTIALDKEKVCELEDSLEYLFVWNEYDNCHREFEEFKEKEARELEAAKKAEEERQAEEDKKKEEERLENLRKVYDKLREEYKDYLKKED